MNVKKSSSITLEADRGILQTNVCLCSPQSWDVVYLFLNTYFTVRSHITKQLNNQNIKQFYKLT